MQSIKQKKIILYYRAFFLLLARERKDKLKEKQKEDLLAKFKPLVKPDREGVHNFLFSTTAHIQKQIDYIRIYAKTKSRNQLQLA